MPKINCTIDYIGLDVNKLKEKLIDTIEKEMRNAAAEFAKAALAQIPVHTGFVAGSFGTLEALLGNKSVFNPIVSFVRRLLGRKNKLGIVASKLSGHALIQNEYYYAPGGGKVLKTPTSGQQFATPTDQIIKKEGNVITFTYTVDISYFNIQDIHSGNSPTAPWHAFEVGREAFVQHMSKSIDKLPNPFDFLIKSTKTI